MDARSISQEPASQATYRQLHPNTVSTESAPHAASASDCVTPRTTSLAEAVSQFDQEAESEQLADWMRFARTLMRHRDFPHALTLLRQVLWKNHEHIEAIQLMATALESSQRFEEAIKCRRALVKLLGSVDSKLDLAQLHYQLESDGTAYELYQNVLATESIPELRQFDVYKNIGNILVRRREFDLAEEYYNRSFSIDSKSDVLLVNYGTLEINRDNIEAATERFRSALAINSANDKAWVGLALIHRSKGDFELSWGNLERALDLNPSNRTALRLEVEWAVRDGRIQSAIERMRNYLIADCEDSEIAFQLAKCLTLVGRFDEALFECERVIAFDPDQEEAFRLRRVLAERLLEVEK